MSRIRRFYHAQIRFLNLTPLILAGLSLSPTQAQDIVTYDDHIFPILEANCLNCHNPDKKKGDLDLSTYEGTLTGGSGGKITLAGDGASSKLYTVSVQTEDPIMPPEGDQLDKEQTDLFRKWIDGGLLETKSSKKKQPKKPDFKLEDITDPQTRPEGPPPMPGKLSREPIIVTNRTTTINDMAASPWAPVLAITGQRQVLLYHTDDLTLLGILPFPHGTPESLAFHPNGKRLVVGGGIGGKSGTTMTWDITTGKLMMQQGREYDSVLAADIHPDLGTLALGGPLRILKIWDTQKAEERFRVKKHTDWITALNYSPNGTLLASGGRQKEIHLWDSDTAEEHYTLSGHQGAITDLKWRSDSKVLASASMDGHLILWNAPQGKQIKKHLVHQGGVLAMDYHRNGLIITSGRDRKVKFWKHNLTFRQELPLFKKEVTEVEFSHDGKRFFTADWNGQIQAWKTEGFQPIGEITSNPPKIADRLAKLTSELDLVNQQIKEKKNALTEQETLLAAASEPDPRTSQLVQTLKGEHGQLHERRILLETQIKDWQNAL